MMFYRARYYQPTTGRFASEDPIRWRGGINWYSYVLNNPTNSKDPNGLQTKTQADALTLFLENWLNTLSTVKDFINEEGEPYRIYGEGTFEQSNMRRSQGVQEIREMFIAGKCKRLIGRTGTGEEFIETLSTMGSNPTQAQFGSYEYTVIPNEDGTVTFMLDNQINIPSALYHIPLPKQKRGGVIPLMGNLDQKVIWTEKINCDCP